MSLPPHLTPPLAPAGEARSAHLETQPCSDRSWVLIPLSKTFPRCFAIFRLKPISLSSSQFLDHTHSTVADFHFCGPQARGKCASTLVHTLLKSPSLVFLPKASTSWPLLPPWLVYPCPFLSGDTGPLAPSQGLCPAPSLPGALSPRHVPCSFSCFFQVFTQTPNPRELATLFKMSHTPRQYLKQ